MFTKQVHRVVCQLFTWGFFALLAVNKMMIIFVHPLTGEELGTKFEACYFFQRRSRVEFFALFFNKS